MTTETTTGRVLCGNCRKNGKPKPFHKTVELVRKCYLKRYKAEEAAA